ncbi:putative integral membrane protein conserved region-domain-containing protein [Powellomyces hirtus]|nr:putative integral membrane protein conserved region-domain-containing protein [Powellomyces hirtus]
MAAWEAEGVHPPPLLPTAANWSTTSTAITCPTSTSHPILTHLFAFSLGSLTTFLVLTLAMVVFIHWLPYYIYPVKAKRGFTPPRRGAKRRPRGGEEHSCSPVVEVVVPDTVAENADEQLQMRGWIRWSVRVLTVAELSELDGSEDGAISGGGWRGGRKSRTFTQASKDIVVSASKSAHTMYSVTRSVGSYLINRFRGQQLSDAYVPPPPPPAPTAPPRPPSWHTAFAVLKYKTLHLYTSEDCTECTDVLAVSDFVIDLYPPQPARGGTDLDIYLRTNPIRLTPKDPHHHHASPHIAGGRPLFIYCPTNSDKEDWHVMLRRAKKLPANADEGACSVFFQDSPPVRAYRAAMEKLTKTIHANTTQSPHDVSSAWLNALVGRAFVGIHSNPALKRWVLEKLSRRSMHYHRDEGDQPGAASFLGDIVVQDINVGNSVPVLSNPHLLELSVDGDMTIEMDVEYTGGVRIEAATLATISIDTLNHLAPLQVPIVVGVQIVHFAARIVIKVKGMWETNRMWVGIQQDPPVKLEMKVEPLVGHKLQQQQQQQQRQNPPPRPGTTKPSARRPITSAARRATMESTIRSTRWPRRPRRMRCRW